MKKIESGSLAVMLDEETLGLRIEKDGVVWNTDPKKTPELILQREHTVSWMQRRFPMRPIPSASDAASGAIMRDLREHRMPSRRLSGSKLWMKHSGWSGFRSARRDCIR